MKNKRSVKTSPRTLQRLALGAVVVFGLLMAYAINYTQNTVEKVRANHLDPTQAALLESPHDQQETPNTSE